MEVRLCGEGFGIVVISSAEAHSSLTHSYQRTVMTPCSACSDRLVLARGKCNDVPCCSSDWTIVEPYLTVEQQPAAIYAQRRKSPERLKHLIDEWFYSLTAFRTSTSQNCWDSVT